MYSVYRVKRSGISEALVQFCGRLVTESDIPDWTGHFQWFKPDILSIFFKIPRGPAGLSHLHPKNTFQQNQRQFLSDSGLFRIIVEIVQFPGITVNPV